MAAYIILHKGFCESMLGNIDESRTSYEIIIARFPDSETAMVAWKLLEFINKLDDELKAAREAPEVNSMAYGKRLYLLMDYKNAITVFTNLEKRRQALAPEALFLKGRCHEELGESALALENYRKILSKYGRSTWAKEANRRMYILGQFYERDKEITELALKRLEEYRDERFFKELSSFTGILKETKVTDDLRIKQRKTVREALNKQNVDVLELIENIDLTGAKAAKEAEALEVKQRKTKDLNAGKLDPNMHPLRKPSFIAREITRKCVPLQSTYNRMLRSEKPFAGTLRLVFYIESNGRTSKVQISRDSDVLNQKFNAFVLEQVRDWRFPKIENRYLPLKVTYPILFTKNR
jgi:tetratricopeptide (TPR) repeat protein